MLVSQLIFGTANCFPSHQLVAEACITWKTESGGAEIMASGRSWTDTTSAGCLLEVWQFFAVARHENLVTPKPRESRYDKNSVLRFSWTRLELPQPEAGTCLKAPGILKISAKVEYGCSSRWFL